MAELFRAGFSNRQFLPPQAAQDSIQGNLSRINWTPYQDEAVRLMQEYLRIDTSNPPGNEIRAAEFFHKLFDQAGIPNTIYTYAPDRANLYAVLKGDGTLPAVILLNHTDVVRADSTQWKVPPFSGGIVDGELYGRGTEDMKDEGLIQAMVMLVAAREHLPLKRDLIFLATADEEVGDTGSLCMLANHPELVKGAQYLITEGGSNLIQPGGAVWGIDVAEKAPFWIRMVATGQGGHGSVPIADSAPNRLVEAMHRVVNWQTPIKLLPSVEQYFHEIASKQKGTRAVRFRDIRRALKDPAFVRLLAQDSDLNYMLRDTVSLTVMQGSSQTNVIPDSVSCDFDVRLLPGEDPNDFLRQLRAVVADDRIQLQPITPFRAPNASSTDTTLFRTMQQVVHKYNPEAVVAPALDSGYTECQMYRPLGITCYGFAPVEVTPEEDATQHAANERIPVQQIRRGTKLLYEVVARIGNVPN